MTAPDNTRDNTRPRTIGLLGATTVGVGAIVGGGIFVLAGVAYARTGPATVVAFALNGAIALLTALSFAEISSAFPESGGAYRFAKKVLSVRSAFAIGWVLWFAYIVAGVLYAVGFASYAALAIERLWAAAGTDVPGWLHDRRMQLLLASGAAIAYAAQLVRKSTGGGQWATGGKLVVFGVLVVAGAVALARQPLPQTSEALTPFFSGGAPGLLAAMGFTFIALQGFDLIATVAGEVKAPARNIPRAMFLSLGTALVVYLPLLLIVAAVGADPDTGITALAAAQPETLIPVAVARYMGPVGYWLVVVAAILSTLSALHANILAASRVAQTMARDHTLPGVLGELHARHGTPVMALYATTLTLVAIVFMIPDLAGAGAAASLIFLLSFALTHVTAYLARVRSSAPAEAFRTPLFPLVPLVGGLACAGLATFQAVVTPVATAIMLIWLALGGMLYVSLLANRARTADASAQARDPLLVKLRGHSPLVLVPVANPAHAPALVAVASALVPSSVGRVLLLSIVATPDAQTGQQTGQRGLQDQRGLEDQRAGTVDGDRMLARLADAQSVVQSALTTSYATGQTPEALITAAPDPWPEIRRVAEMHGCECLLLGLRRLPGAPARDDHTMDELEELINVVACDVALMCMPPSWRLEDARRVLVPLGGRGEQHALRARLLGSITRGAAREVTFLRIVPTGASEAEAEEARRNAERLARDNLPGAHAVEIVRSDDVVGAVADAAAHHDLLILGLQVEHTTFRMGRSRAIFGSLALDMARRAPCATIMLSGRRGSFISL